MGFNLLSRNRGKSGARIALMAVLLLTGATLVAQQWTPVGPYGGDVRSLAYDPQNPNRILLGTSAGQLFASNDGGASWSRLAHLGEGDDYVLDHIVFHPQDGTLYVAAWSVEDNNGDLFRSRDGGKTWEALPGMHGKSIRSFAMASSDPQLLFVGTLDGVYRSNDGGLRWQRISPEQHAEIKNIESLAVDPKDPRVIYAGTWHLPWKTIDGGATWLPMKRGLIDDSDVFSIIVSHQSPAVVFVSACSGIYKSEDAGEQFHKVQGIPFSARRTRVLHQDPVDASVVYAGTTEGLWKTQDAGKTWKRVSAPNIIVNDVLVDPRRPGHVLLATDRSGVLVSENSGATWVASNRGFAHRQVASLLVDRNDSNVLYAGLINDKEFGGVFVSRDGGIRWEQHNSGLGSRDVFVLRHLASGELLAGTNNGMFALRPGDGVWRSAGTVLSEPKSVTVKVKNSKRTRTVMTVERSEIKARIFEIDQTGAKIYTATSAGLYVSDDGGRTWRGGPVLGNEDIITVRATPQLLVAATHRKLLASVNGGADWYEAKVPDYVTALRGVTVDGDNTIWLATREGAFRSNDGGDKWEHVLAGLPHKNLLTIAFDEESRRLMATAVGSRDLFESTDSGRSWHRTAAGFTLRSVVVVHGRLLANTAYDGIVMQPTNEPTAPNAGGGAQPEE
jgi:photosystem II stability/assembly factor-like uncharacterized protein